MVTRSTSRCSPHPGAAARARRERRGRYLSCRRGPGASRRARAGNRYARAGGSGRAATSGEGEGPREVLRVLRGDDEEGLGQGNRLPVEGDLSLVHGLEKSGLRPGARAVDLVGQEDVREDGALAKHELALALVVHADAEHVARQEVARELDATCRSPPTGLGESPGEGRLANARHILDEQVPTTEERDQCELDRVLLAFQGALHGLSQRLERGQLLGDAGSGRHTGQSSTASPRGTRHEEVHV